MAVLRGYLFVGLGWAMRHLTWVILSYVVAGLLTMVVVSAAASSAFVRFGFADSRVLGLVSTSSLVALVAGVAVFFALVRNQRALAFTDEVVDELAKVTWPTRDETVRASITVVVTTMFVAGLLAAYDFLWKNVADYFLFGSAG